MAEISESDRRAMYIRAFVSGAKQEIATNKNAVYVSDEELQKAAIIAFNNSLRVTEKDL